MRLLDYRTGLEVIERDDCLRLLGQRQYGMGRLALVDNGHPVILPVNYALDGDRPVFRTAAGSKLEAALKGAPVAFEVDEFDDATHGGWSVLVKGFAEVLPAPADVFRLSAMPLRPWAEGDRPVWVQVRPEIITGRRVPGHAR